MLDQANIRTSLSDHYNLAPSVELAEAMADLHAKMGPTVTFPDWAIFAPYVAAINKLKREKNAVILAHNYMTP